MRNHLARLFLPLAVATFLIGGARPAWSQSCTWGGTPTMSPPANSALWADQTQLQTPARLATDAEGKVYVTDTAAGRVIVRDPWGRLVSVKQGLVKPLAIGVDAFGLIYVGEAATGSVSVFGPWWDLRFKFGQGDGEFAMPNHISIDPDPSFPRVYVADSAANVVKVYSNMGGLLFQFGSKGTGAGQFDFPAGVHVSGAGEIFVADQNNDRVQVFDRTGTFLRCFGGSTTQRFGRIQGITSDAAGRVYVADAFQGSVWVFEPGGARLGTVGAFGEGPGELTGVGGMAIDGNSRLLVASTGSGRVAAYAIDGYDNPRAIHGTAEFLPPDLARRWRRGGGGGRGKPEPLQVLRAASIEIRDAPLRQVRPESITANGVRATSSSFGDRDFNGVPEITAYFERAALVATFPPDAWTSGEGFVGIAGELVDGTPLEATAVFDLRGESLGTKLMLREAPPAEERDGPAPGEAIPLKARKVEKLEGPPVDVNRRKQRQ